MATGDAMKMAINATIHGTNIVASDPARPIKRMPTHIP
jgi:hypothetical protein